MAHKYKYKGSIGSVDEDERIIIVVRKHAFGIVQLYIASGVGILMAILFLSFFVAADVPNELLAAITAAGFMLGIFMVIVLLIATWIYYANRLIITTKNITQILQRGLFSKKISQLAMTNVEDVTADQHGFFATMFNYGTLKIETAGEQVNFHFTYTPDCYNVAKQVLEAREAYIEYDPDRAERGNADLHVRGSGVGGTMYQNRSKSAMPAASPDELPQEKPEEHDPPLH